MHGHDEPMSAIPEVGEHTTRILHELGYLDYDIAELVAAGAVGR
jgi:crotonobetainyl-CoA:carnitine CoA-transferase CaiB-like acyl-CoA transferase